MQIEAIYNEGRIELTKPLHLRHSRVRVLVEVPDEEVIAPPVAPDPIDSDPMDQDDLLTEIRQILGPLDRRRLAASPADDKHALIDSLAEKHAR
ncbi:MAG: hypothetical protein AADX96_26840 [Thiocapsa sp. C3-sup]|uniref:hypothetical protein n=1 Tax=unclassified Thiocapsa TaxID=2641286 RepID=UPI0035B3ED90